MDAEEIHFFDNDTACNHSDKHHFFKFRPYIVFVMELGIQSVQPQPLRNVSKRLKLPSTPNTVPTLEHSCNSMTLPTSHYRYQIFAYGCSSTIYKVIQPKPLFKFGPDSYSWLIDPVLNTPIVVDRVDGMVIVGTSAFECNAIDERI